MRGMFLRRVFPEPKPATCTISFNWPYSVDNSLYLITSDGAEIFPPDDYEVQFGDTIRVCYFWGGIVVNGELSQAYEADFEINGDITIAMHDDEFLSITGPVGNYRVVEGY